MYEALLWMLVTAVNQRGKKPCPHEAYIFRGYRVSYPGVTGREQAPLPVLGGGGFPYILGLATLKELRLFVGQSALFPLLG